MLRDAALQGAGTGLLQLREVVAIRQDQQLRHTGLRLQPAVVEIEQQRLARLQPAVLELYPPGVPLLHFGRQHGAEDRRPLNRLMLHLPSTGRVE